MQVYQIQRFSRQRLHDSDAVSRFRSQHLSQSLGQPVRFDRHLADKTVCPLEARIGQVDAVDGQQQPQQPALNSNQQVGAGNERIARHQELHVPPAILHAQQFVDDGARQLVGVGDVRLPVIHQLAPVQRHGVLQRGDAHVFVVVGVAALDHVSQPAFHGLDQKGADPDVDAIDVVMLRPLQFLVGPDLA